MNFTKYLKNIKSYKKLLTMSCVYYIINLASREKRVRNLENACCKEL